MSVEIKLSKPVTAHGKEIDSLTLRPPTTGEIMEIGSPQLMMPSADGVSIGVEIRPSVIGRYVVKLAGIPLSSVKELAPADFSRCQGAVMDFLMAGDGEAETNSWIGSSTSPTSGD